MIELPDEARKALATARAASLSYSVRILRAPDGRLVAVLGETHVKLERAAAIGRAVVASFELRGVETFQRKQLVGGRALSVVISAPRLLLRALSAGAIRGSTITDAKQLPSGYTVELERTKRAPLGLHVAAVYMTAFFVVSFLALFAPLLGAFGTLLRLAALGFQLHLLALLPGIPLRRHSWSWVIHPFLGILTLRDILMAAGTVRMLEDHPRTETAVVVMGRAHVEGYQRVLCERHGFVALPDTAAS